MTIQSFIQKSILQTGLFVSALFLALPSHAAVVITPANSIPGTAAMGPSNCEPSCVYQTFGLTNDGSLQLLYKADVGTENNPATVESGLYASSYMTTFSLSALDPSAALIEYVSGSAIQCPSCYLAIKDGNATPAYYFFNLATWNGTDALDLSGFWPSQGAISHVSIWGVSTPGEVPEPATLALLGFGMLGVAALRRRAS
ncbi:MAG: PEP-CTERM sorting domain-containing protein [Hydrogenophaga sp.]|uniref:PEP-CTERM sorting domain-containing protein n=1 Tax=Hydrogenophaga sp. TaxID=1904254 RepID=UPI0027347EF8|nr:PEP-CTERM sorting domain-containing protein [Hydrogenophaga sp.]MDP3348099.1 PEP-CTERM sorting domain-containing protein [Hydrogenophaga sp.]